MPLLDRTTRALQANGWQVLQAGWELPALPPDPRGFVTRVAERLEGHGPAGRPVLVVGKSLGTLAAWWAAGRGYPAVWLTPVLTAPELDATLRDYPAPSLVVGGTADALWERGFTGSGRVLEVDGADHSLELPDRGATARLHEEVVRAVADVAAQATLTL